MAKQTERGIRKGDQDDSSVRQPAWRRAPSRPRNQIKRNSFAVQRAPVKKKQRAVAPALVMPSRAMLLSLLRGSVLLLVTAGVAVGLLSLLWWPLLAVSPATTEIGGEQRISPAEIYERSSVDGRNILILNAHDVVSQVTSLPGIASADVHMRLPNRVIIDVVEHAPLVAWQGVTATVWLAADGSTLPQVGGVPPVRLVDVSEGRLDSDAPLRSLVLENLKSLHALRPELSEFYYGRSQGLYYRTAQGWDVWLGETGPLSTKLALVDAAGQDIVQQGARAVVIDVRHSDRKALWW